MTSVAETVSSRLKHPVSIARALRSWFSLKALTRSALACLALASSAQALPNLTPYKPSGWSDKIVVSNVTGSTDTSAVDASPLRTTDILYVSWAVINNGTTSFSAAERYELDVDGVSAGTWQDSPTPPFDPNLFLYVSDFSIGSLPAGNHTLKIKADTTNIVAESNESDNTYTRTITVVAPGGNGGCTPNATTLCLLSNRFKVTVSWKNQHSAGQTGVGSAVPNSDRTGFFWFFTPDSIELVVKIVDGRGLNGKFWVFYGALSDVEYTITVTDKQTGAVKTYHNAPGSISGGADTSAFSDSASQVEEVPTSQSLDGTSLNGPQEQVATFPVDPEALLREAGTSCVASSTHLCLISNRFQVSVSWINQHPPGGTGVGTTIPATDQSGYFWFFDPQNVDLVVKIVDGQGLNGSFWVFYGALSDVEYTITVTDTQTGIVRTYHNAPGSISGGADTSFSLSQTFALSGRVMNGAVAGATLQLFHLNADGTRGPVIKSTTTDSNGFFSVSYSAQNAEPILARASAGSYRDEATGQTVTLSTSDLLTAVFPAGTPLAAVTPLTHMAASRARALPASGMALSAAVEASNSGVGQQYQIPDIIQLLPVAVDDAVEAATGTRDQRNYGLVLAGIAEEAHGLGVRAIDLAQALATDMSDGTLDGTNGGSPIAVAAETPGITLEVGGLPGIYLQPDAGTTAVQSGIGSFIADDRNVAQLPTCYILPQPVDIGNGPYTTTAVAPPAISGQAYASSFLNISGGIPPWNWVSGPGMPAWLAISPGGILTSPKVPPLSGGTVAKTYFGLSARATDQSNPQRVLVVQFQITVVPAAPRIQSHDGQCVVNTPCRVLIATAFDGTPPYTFKLDTIGSGTCLLGCPAGQTPPGMLLDFSSGEMYGTPTAANVYKISVCVVDSAGQFACVDPTITVTGVDVSILPTSQSFGASGGSNSVRVTAPPGHFWSAVSNNGWITISSVSSSSGNGTVSYAVAANTSTSQRTGTMTIAGLTFTVNQSGQSPPPPPPPTSAPNLRPFHPAGWSDKIVVSTSAGSTLQSATDSNPLTPSSALYVNWAVTNDGTADVTTAFYLTLYVDGTAVKTWSSPIPVGVPQGSIFDVVNVVNYPIGTLSAGTHTIEIVADSSGVIAESDESDNSYTKTITLVEQCNSQQVAGGNTPETHTVEMGRASGSFTFSYDTYSVPDRMTVSYQGGVLFDTGCVGQQGLVTLSYSGTSTEITVQVSPDCAGEGSTQWTFTVGCPN